LRVNKTSLLKEVAELEERIRYLRKEKRSLEKSKNSKDIVVCKKYE
jgi:uncharacterized small protein (DUF1192 family)